MTVKTRFRKLLIWRRKNIKDKQFIMFLSILVGIVVGFAAVIIKNSVLLIESLLKKGVIDQYQNYLYFILPAIGVLGAVLFTRYILKRTVGHGIPTTLYGISKDNGKIRRHNMFSSIITSALTVGFGGSVGLEGPTVATGAAWGSNIGRFFQLSYKQTILLIACAATGAMSAIFKAPIAAIVFVLEVIMLDLTMASLLPLLFASVSAAITSYLFLGMDVLYPIQLVKQFSISEVPYYIVLGILSGLVSVYFARTYKFLQDKFDSYKNVFGKWIVGGSLLGLLIFLFPSLYGEGYEAINSCLHGDYGFLFEDSLFHGLKDKLVFVFLFFILIILFKVVATTLTFGSGGVGGMFAPTLFVGAGTGLMFVLLVNHLGLAELPATPFTLGGMAGLISGVLHAPLTSIFLIAETTGGYKLFFPLMISATVSYAIIRIFEKYSVYTYQLARRGALFTHDKDKVVLSMMHIEKLIEKNFKTINEDATLGDLVNVIAESERNIIPVIDKDKMFLGIVFINDIRNIMFKRELYDKVYVHELMFMPSPMVDPDESMEEVAKKFQYSSHYNLPVVKEGRYVGFVSRANVFSAYRKLLKEFSEE